MTFVDKYKLLFFFVQSFVISFCAFYTVSHIIYGNVSYIKVIVVPLLFTLTMVYRERKKQIRKTED